MFKIYEDAAILQRQSIKNEIYPAALLARLAEIFGEALSPELAVTRILADVRTRGDAALREWTQRIDGIELQELSVPAVGTVDEKLMDALKFAAERARRFHAQQPILSWLTEDLT